MKETRIGAEISVTGWVARAERKGNGFQVTVPMGTRKKDKDTGEFTETYKAWYVGKVWGDRANTLENTGVKKGDKVRLTGKFEPEEYNGKPQFTISFPELEIIETAADDGEDL